MTGKQWAISLVTSALLAGCSAREVPVMVDGPVVEAYNIYGSLFYVVRMKDGTRCVVTGSRGGVDCDWQHSTGAER